MAAIEKVLSINSFLSYRSYYFDKIIMKDYFIGYKGVKRIRESNLHSAYEVLFTALLIQFDESNEIRVGIYLSNAFYHLIKLRDEGVIIVYKYLKQGWQPWAKFPMGCVGSFEDLRSNPNPRLAEPDLFFQIAYSHALDKCLRRQRRMLRPKEFHVDDGTLRLRRESRFQRRTSNKVLPKLSFKKRDSGSYKERKRLKSEFLAVLDKMKYEVICELEVKIRKPFGLFKVDIDQNRAYFTPFNCPWCFNRECSKWGKKARFYKISFNELWRNTHPDDDYLSVLAKILVIDRSLFSRDDLNQLNQICSRVGNVISG